MTRLRKSAASTTLAATLVLLGAAFLLAPPGDAATQQYQYTAACYDCHGSTNDIRPIDEAFRNITTGGFEGSHRTHLAQTTDKNVCQRCHSGSNAYTTGHMNDQVEMTANINASPGVSTYSKTTTFFSWTSNQAGMGTCSTVNCHFQTITPAWSSAPFNNAGTGDCNKCHGAPPNGTGTSGTAGSHAKHDSYFTGAAECKKCHTDHLAESNRFSHATSVTSGRGIAIELHDPANVAGGTYSGTRTNFLPSQSGSQVFGSCSALYCHSQGKSAASFTGSNAAKTAPTWGTAAIANCAGCHGGNVSAGFNMMSSASHLAHINNATKVGRNIGCEQCHNATTTNGTAIATAANHVNKNVNIKFDNSGINKDADSPTYGGASTTGGTGATKAPGSAFADCTNIYCHSDGHPVAGSRTFRTITWNGAAIDCNDCHGTGNGSGYPDHANAGAGIAGSNSHTVHAGAGYAFGCVRCHSGTTNDGTSVISGGAHLSGTSSVAGTDVKFDALNPSGAYAGGKTCATTYCHSSNGGTPKKIPAWGDTMPADCTGCHGGNAAVASYNIMSSGRHTAHMNNPAVLGTANNFKCMECHAATVNSTDRTIIDKTKHVNNTKDFSGAKAGNTYNTATGTCSTVYCHSSGQATPVYRSMTGSKAWRASGTLSCAGCHGYGPGAFTPVAGEPNYTSGAAGSATANTHQKHVAGRNITDSRGCADCHRLTVDQGVAGKLKNYSSSHLNTTREVNFRVFGGYTGHYTAATKSCSNTYCHSSGSPQWGGAPLACNSCHNAKANDANWAGASAHKLHWEGTNVPTSGMGAGNGTGDATTYRFACASCHLAAPHAAGPVSANQAAQVYFGYTTAGRVGTYTPGGASAGQDGALSFTAGGNCTTTYCHSNGNGGAGTGAVTWSTTTNSGTANARCNTCHRYTAASGTAMNSSWHTTHVTTYAIGCQECHNATTTNGTAITDKTKHVNKQKDVAWGTMNSGGNAFVNGTTTCSNIYCHSRGTATSAPYATPINTTFTWQSAPGSITCTSCHGNSATAGGNALSGAHAKHVNSPTVLGAGNSFGCVECHAKTVSNSTTISDRTKHVNKMVDYSGARAGSGASYSAGCSTTYCHSNGNTGSLVYVQPPAWGSGSTLGCNGCHGSSAAPDFNAAATGAPNYASGGAASATANSHKRHVFDSGITDTTGCVTCHNKTVDATTPGKFKDYSAATYHINRQRDLSFKEINGKTGSFDSGTARCSNTYCHGAAAGPQWGSTTALACNTCHSAKGDAGYWNTNSAHKIHWEGATLPSAYNLLPGNSLGDATTYRFACSSCHYPGSSTSVHAGGPANANGAAQVFFGYTTGSIKGTYTYGATQGTTDNGFNWTNGTNCTTTYCHSNGNGGAGTGAVTWSTTTNSGTANARCNTCHRYTAASGTAMNTGKHTMHVSTYGISCAQCHNTTTTDGSSIADKRVHLNKTKDVTWSATIGGATAYSAPNCSNIYCHSQGTTFSAPYTGAGKAPNVAAAWNGTMSAGCGSCHDGTATGPTYASGSPKANTHSKHVSLTITCDQCHFATTTTGTTVTTAANHANKQYDLQANGSKNFAGAAVSFTVAVQGNPTTPSQCSNISCHGGNSATWGATLYCQNCHTGAADVDNFTTPFTKDSAVAIVKSGEWTSTGHGRTVGNYASGTAGAGFSGNNQCEYCHDAAVNHNAATNIFRLRNYSTPDWGRNGPCMVCHGAGSTGVTAGGVPKNGSKKVSAMHYGANHGLTNNGGLFCWDCHDGHGDTSAYMIQAKVAKLSDRATGAPTSEVATAFTLSSPPAWGDYVNGGFTGLCQVCHAPAASPTKVAHFRSDLYDTNHNPGTRCTVCHSHNNADAKTQAFKPAGNCDLCHGYPPVRRGLAAGTVFAQNNYTSAKFEDYSGGGGAHSIERHVPATAKASDGWLHCAVCHSNGSMNPGGSHTMQTPVTPSKLTIDVKDKRKFDYRRSLDALRYTGTLTDKDGDGKNTNKVGRCSNVNCHMQPSKKWSTDRQ